MDDAALGRLIEDLEPLWSGFRDAGHRLYLVGGVVRDRILRLPMADGDIDLTTDAPPETTRSLVAPLASAMWVQGERFGTIGARVAGRAVEITTHRAESYAIGSRKPEVSFGTDLHVDLSRRDFTINAMAFELPAGPLHDPYGGRTDLARRRLRTPLDPATSFGDDPLRMLRAARFVARFGLEADADLVATATASASRLRIVASERIHDELERLLATKDPAPGLRLLATTGLLGQFLPTLAAVADDHDERLGAPTRFELVARVMRDVPVLAARRALLLWPLDAATGSAAVDEALLSLRYPNAERTRTVRLVAALGRALADDDPGPPLIRSLTWQLGDDADALWTTLAAFADAVGQPEWLAELLRTREEMRDTGELGSLEVPIDGRAVVSRLACRPGPAVGEALAMLRERIISDGPLDEPTALAVLDQWWAERAR